MVRICDSATKLGDEGDFTNTAPLKLTKFKTGQPYLGKDNLMPDNRKLTVPTRSRTNLLEVPDIGYRIPDTEKKQRRIYL